MSPRPPVIVIGMHRSGTSVVFRVLERLGVFAGWRLEENYESRFFQRLNRWIMDQAGSRWDYPESIQELLSSPEARAMILDRLENSLSGVESMEYLGIRKWLRFRSPCHIPDQWGWKDPRNTFTLPFWLEMFPQARCIDVCRHGVDVAASLRARSAKDIERQRAASNSLARRGLASWLSGDSVGLARCRTLEGGFSLWLSYMNEAHRHATALQDRYCKVSYEVLLGNPESTLSEISRFCQLEATDESIAGAAALIRPSRRYAYRQSEELEAFAARQASDLAKFGY
ncbi:MAG: sulfotransferase [Alphaproteobacteria bacterium]|nr:sulfotransferase [Alphaproteobacteria bacterium]